jgi:STE24 endopeptidase
MIMEAILAVDCAHVAVPEATEQAMRYYHSGNILWIFNQLWGLIIPLLFLLTGFSGILGSWAKKSGKKWFFSLVIYLILFVAIYKLLYFPIDFYAGYIREHDFGLSTQALGKWFENFGLDVLITLISAVAFVWIFYLLLKKSPRRWWFYGSLASIVITFFMGFIQPIWINPLFNHFGPMKNHELEQKILHLASRAGIENSRVFEVDKSQETKKLNAYVIGFGSTKRVVLWDTTIARMSTDEILFVMGHEMGHYVLNHLWWDLLYSSALTFVIFYLTYRSATYLLRHYQKRFRFNHLYDIASFPLLLFLISIFTLLSSPLSNYVSRCVERQADRFGLEITQNNKAAAEAFLVLQKGNLANPRPGPIYVFWRSSHPSLGDRVDFCNHYCPWKEGKPLKYAELFKDQ